MTDAFDAWYLPDVEAEPTEQLDAGALTCRYPRPTADLIRETTGALMEAGARLRDRSVADVVEIIAAAAGRLGDPADRLRQEAERRLPAATGYSPEMARLVLDRMSADWRAGALQRLLTSELAEPGVLDGFRAVAPGRRARAYGPRLAFHVFAGNVPGVAVTSLVRALLVKAPSLGKLASGQPVLPVLFARAVESVDPELARALAVTYWPGGSETVEQAEAAALEASDMVVVYGAGEAAGSYRRRARENQKIVIHGPRFSVGLVAAPAIEDGPDELTRRVARSVVAFDQHGCVSPHALWVEESTDGAALKFAAALADALDAIEPELPRGTIRAAEASAIQQERAAAELRGHDASDGPRVFASEGTRWTVVYDPEPAFRASCLNRFVRVHPVSSLEEVPPLLAPHGPLLQSVAVAGLAPVDNADSTGADPKLGRLEQLTDDLAQVGATRVTTFERLPWPPPDWHHDGSPPLGELLRWVDLER